MTASIEKIEGVILKVAQTLPYYQKLKTLPGVGVILGQTITMEVGDIRRFAEAGNFVCVGDVNARFIREFLANEGIPLLAEDLGGEKGRVIHFSNGDYAVLVRKIEQTRSARLARRDRAVWRRAIEQQETTMPSVDLWR